MQILVAARKQKILKMQLFRFLHVIFLYRDKIFSMKQKTKGAFSGVKEYRKEYLNKLSSTELLFEFELYWRQLFLFGKCSKEEYKENIISKLNLYNNEKQETK